MSQAKVDRYKEEKKNRKQTMKKEKRNRVLARSLGVVIAAAVVCWIVRKKKCRFSNTWTVPYFPVM